MHAGDISIVNILLVEVFDDWTGLAMRSLEKLQFGEVSFTLRDTTKGQKKSVETSHKGLLLRRSHIAGLCLIATKKREKPHGRLDGV